MTNAISPGTRIMQAEATYVRTVLKLGICSVTKLRRLFVTLECVEIRIYAHTIEAVEDKARPFFVHLLSVL